MQTVSRVTIADTGKKAVGIAQMHGRAGKDAHPDSEGQQGRKTRKLSKPTSPRPNQNAGWKPQMPESLAEPWLPFDLGSEINVAVLSDIHIPYHSKVALDAAVKHTAKRKPDVLLLNGDVADFYSISRHQKDPSKRDLKTEMKLIRQGLEWLRHVYGKQCRIVFKLGNHEERWQHYLWNNAPEISDDPRMDVGEWIDARKHGIEIVGDQRPVMCGKLPVMHGHEPWQGWCRCTSKPRARFVHANDFVHADRSRSQNVTARRTELEARADNLLVPGLSGRLQSRIRANQQVELRGRVYRCRSCWRIRGRQLPYRPCW